MKDYSLKITDDFIMVEETGKIVMHRWEDEIMKKKAEWVCKNGGDILEIGFGMGISADYIQQHDINSHTICEIHPQVLENLNEWKKDKKNVTILEGDWIKNISHMKKYDGILFDTFDDYNNTLHFPKILKDICKSNCLITWWNNSSAEYDEFNFGTTTFDSIEVDPPQNTYFNFKNYHMPKYIY